MKKFYFFDFEIEKKDEESDMLSAHGLYADYDFLVNVLYNREFPRKEIMSLLKAKFNLYIQLQQEIETLIAKEVSTAIISDFDDKYKNESTSIRLQLDKFIFFCGSEDFIVQYLYCDKNYLIKIEAEIVEDNISRIETIEYLTCRQL